MSAAAFGQLIEEPDFRVMVTEQEEVYVFHSATLPLGFGYNLYRREVGQQGSEAIRLNDEPIRSVSSEAQLRAELGTLYWELQSTMSGFDSDRQMIYTLRNDDVTGMLATYLYPELAKSLGRLWIDDDAPLHSEVIYTIRVLDEFGDESGVEFDYRTELIPGSPPPPASLAAENVERLITLTWDYQVLEGDEDDFVVQFEINQISDDGSEIRVDDEVIIRNNADSRHEYQFSVSELDREYIFSVNAVDIAGQKTPVDEPVTIFIEDNTQPPFLENVTGFQDDDGSAVVTWPVSTAGNAVGYHVYRTETSEQNAPLERLTEEPLPVHQTSYVDSLAGLSGETELWFYRITVVSQAGVESLPSNAAMVNLPIMQAPPPAANLNAELQDDGTVQLWWESPEMPDYFETWIIMRKELERRGDEPAVRVSPDSLADTQFTDTGGTELGLTEGAVYEYRVASQSGDKYTSDYQTVKVEIPKITPPDAPGNVSASNDNGFRVRVNWSPSADRFIESYQIYRLGTNGEPERIGEVPADELIFRDEQVSAGNEYSYKITAADSFGNISDYSAAASTFVRHFTPPQRVRNVRAEEADSGVAIRWERVPGDDIAGYRILSSDIPTGVFEPVHDGLVETTEFIDDSGSRGVWYRVVAIDRSTNQSRPSEPAQARGGE